MANVLYERVGAASLLTIDRPERRNAIDGQTAEELLAGYLSFESDESARVLVVTGSGDKAFSAGADLKAIETLAPRANSAEGVLGFTRLVSPKPTIAAISGWCVAAGVVLALGCDLRIATEDARFRFPDRKWGVPILDGGTKRLPPTSQPAEPPSSPSAAEAPAPADRRSTLREHYSAPTQGSYQLRVEQAPDGSGCPSRESAGVSFHRSTSLSKIVEGVA